MTKRVPRIDTFGLEPGETIAGKYEVESFLGAGWEGEVYKVQERKVGVTRAAKLFFPERNTRDRAVKFYARKLERLRSCPIIIKYHHSETLYFQGQPVTVLISDYVEGALLEDLIARQPGRRFRPFEALHLLHALASGVEDIHNMREYHGDLHAANVLVQRRGIFFDVKLVDMFHWGAPSAANIREDVINMIRIFYDALGGARHYPQQRAEIKSICLGLKRGLISRRFPTAGRLRQYLERFSWQED